MKNTSPLVLWFGIILLILVTGTVGFYLIEPNFSFLDSLYMTVITIATIGYGETHRLSEAGRIFNVIFIISSFSIFTYVLARLTQYIVNGEMAAYFKNKKLMNKIESLNKHVIVCGFGRNGRQAAITLQFHNEPFVVIENHEKNINEYIAEHPDFIYIHGNATDDSILKRAGIEKAKALICSLPVDADNLFIVLSARSLNNNLQIISRASEINTIQKLKKAGANNVIMPDKIGGNHMATLVSKPDVIEFIDYISGEQGQSISMESVAYETFPEGLKNQSLHTIMEWKKTGVNCIGIKDEDGKFVINPPDETIIKQGMKIIVLGTRKQIDDMKKNINEV